MVANSWHRASLFFLVTMTLAACSSAPQVTRTQEVAAAADPPYKKILVIALFDSFDSRAYLEKELVLKLAALGTDAVASTTMMDSRTPVTRATFIAMVDEIDADAISVTQLTSLSSTAKVKDMQPEATYNIRPTYYYNVFSVDLTEYTEPQSVEIDYSLVLATELLSVKLREPVWTIEAKSKIVQDHEQSSDYSIYVVEADAIASHLLRDGLIAN